MSPTSDLPVKETVNLLPDAPANLPDAKAGTPASVGMETWRENSPPPPSDRKRLFHRIGILALLGVLGLALTWSIRYWSQLSADPSKDAVSAPPSKTQDVFCFGLVDFERGSLSLAPTQSGRVTELLVEENKQVAKGSALLRLEDHQAVSRVAASRATVEVAEVQVEQAGKQVQRLSSLITQQEAAVEVAKQRLLAARETLSRKRRLAELDQLPPEEVTIAEHLVKELEAVQRAEQARLTVQRSQDPTAELRRARAELSSARANLTLAEQALEECTLVAPVDGVVLRMYTKVGDVVGEPVKKPALLFGTRGARMIRAEIDQEFARGLKVDQVAEVQDDIRPDRVWNGWVHHVSDWFLPRREILDELVQTRETRTLECMIALEPNQPPLRIGQRMRVTIKRGALRQKPEGGGQQAEKTPGRPVHDGS